jgi:CYTH domain-containing protein
MGIEIERKFLVVGDEWKQQGVATYLRQGYISAEPGVSCACGLTVILRC